MPVRRRVLPNILIGRQNLHIRPHNLPKRLRPNPKRLLKPRNTGQTLQQAHHNNLRKLELQQQINLKLQRAGKNLW